MDRLYVIVRSDLPHGAQLAQACHALSAFACEYPELHRAWHTGGQNLVALQVADEEALAALFERASVERAAFHEPDFGGALTAIALGGGARRQVSSLGLALKEPVGKTTARCHPGTVPAL